MCTIHYIGTNQKLDVSKFDKDEPDFWIERFDKAKLSPFQTKKINTYIVGTSEGCGCRFGMKSIPIDLLKKAKHELGNEKGYSEDVQQYFDWQETEDQLTETYDEHNKYETDTRKLFDLLETISECENEIEFFGSWAEDEKAKELNVKELNKTDLRIKMNWQEFTEHPTKLIIRNE